jgi:hypothetical protein
MFQSELRYKDTLGNDERRRHDEKGTDALSRHCRECAIELIKG